MRTELELIEEKKQKLTELLQRHIEQFDQRFDKLLPTNGVYKGEIVIKATVYKLTKEYIQLTIPDINKTPNLIHQGLFAKATPEQIAERIVDKAFEFAHEDVEKNTAKYLAELVDSTH